MPSPRFSPQSGLSLPLRLRGKSLKIPDSYSRFRHSLHRDSPKNLPRKFFRLRRPAPFRARSTASNETRLKTCLASFFAFGDRLPTRNAPSIIGQVACMAINKCNGIISLRLESQSVCKPLI